MKTNIILVDFENVQPEDLAALKVRPFKLMVFCGANQTKIKVGLAAQLQPLGADVQYIRIDGTGPNALDFHVAYYIGRLAVQVPEATFYILSKDAGFDPLIKHLRAQNILCHRISALTNLPGLARVNHAPPGRIQKVADLLLNRKDARPRTRKTLAAYIKAQLGPKGTETEAEEVVARLTRGGVEIQTDGKLTYPPMQSTGGQSMDNSRNEPLQSTLF